MRKLSLLASTALVFGSLAFSAQAAEETATMKTQTFIEKAAIGNEFEIKSSQLALEKSENAKVKTFAQKVISDHETAANNLKEQVANANLSQDIIPTQLDAVHAETLAKLNTASGTAFDKAYTEAQIKAHRDAVSTFDDYANNGDNAEIQSFASKTLPTLKTHQKHALELKK